MVDKKPEMKPGGKYVSVYGAFYFGYLIPGMIFINDGYNAS